MAVTSTGDDLVLSRNSVRADASLQDFLTSAAAAGFGGIGMRPEDRERALADGYTDADIRSMLADHGLRLVELEYHRDFALGGEAGERAIAAEQPFYELADALGGQHLFTISDLDSPLDVAAERLAAMADRAARHGLKVAVEYVPYFGVDSIGTAWELVRRADRPNLGILVDSWHHFRGGSSGADVRAVPADRIIAIQVGDGNRELVGTLREDTIHRRVTPGAGELDLVGFVRMLDAHGVRAPWCVEVPGDLPETLTAEEASRRSGDGMRGVLEAARARKE